MSLLRGISMRRGLTFVLVTQFVIAVPLVANDIDARWITRLTQDEDLPNVPVSPGDQLRRYELSLIRPNFTRSASLPDNVQLPQDLPPRLEFKVSKGSGCDILLINGPIEPGDAERFSAFLSNLGELTMSAVLNSPGGAVTEALAIGRLLRENKATTIVHSGTACLSACPYILAGGARREGSSRGAVGMHQHHYDAPAYMPVFLAVEGIQHGQGRTMEYLMEMGSSPSLMLYSLNTPPDSIYVLVKEELLETGLATSVFDRAARNSEPIGAIVVGSAHRIPTVAGRLRRTRRARLQDHDWCPFRFRDALHFDELAPHRSANEWGLL